MHHRLIEDARTPDSQARGNVLRLLSLLWRAQHQGPACTEALDRIRQAARGTENVFPFILEAARRYCTLYEIRAALEDVFGAYREPVFF